MLYRPALRVDPDIYLLLSAWFTYWTESHSFLSIFFAKQEKERNIFCKIQISFFGWVWISIGKLLYTATLMLYEPVFLSIPPVLGASGERIANTSEVF